MLNEVALIDSNVEERVVVDQAVLTGHWRFITEDM